MSSIPNQKSTIWLFALALAWPLDIYQTLPGLGMPLSLLLAVGYVGTAVVERSQYRFQIPFELWWAVVPLVLLGWYQVSFSKGLILPVETILAAAVFLVAAGTIRNRYVVEWALFLSVMSGSVLAVINFVAIESGIPPTAYVLESGVTMVGPASVSGGIFQMGVLCIAAAALAARSHFGPLHRAAATFAVIPLVGSFGGKVWQSTGHAYDWGNSLLYVQPASYLIGLGLLVWLISRVAGKLIVDRKISGNGLHLFFLAGLVFALAYAAIVPFSIRMHFGLMLGLVTAYVMPEREDKPYYFVSAAWYGLPVVLIGLLLMNLPGTSPRSSLDNRGFAREAITSRFYGTHHRLRWHMENLYTIYPSESARLGLWQAQASLKLKEYERGSLEYMWALQQDAHFEKTQTPLDGFLVQYRDLDSTVEMNTLYYERVLAARDGIESVLPIFTLKAERPLNSEVIAIPMELQRVGLAFLLGNLEWEDTLVGEAGGGVTEAMRCDEVSVGTFSSENTFPLDTLLVGYLRTPEGPRVVAVSPDHRAESELDITKMWRIVPERVRGSQAELHLDDVYYVEEEGQQSVAIIYGEGESAVVLAYVYSNADGSLAINWNTALDLRDFPYMARVMVLHR